MDAYEVWSQLETRLLDALQDKDVSRLLPVVLVLAVAILVGFAFTVQQRKPNLDHIPVLGPEIGGASARKDHFNNNSRDFLQRGYDEFKDKSFVIETSDGPRIILSPSQMEEIRAKPDTMLDNVEPIKEALLSKYTKAPFVDDIVIHSIKADLSTKLGSLTEALADQTDKAIAEEIPTADDWTPLNAYAKLLRIVAKVSTRIFIGEELATNEEWLTVSIMYSIYQIESAQDLRKWNPWLRPLVCRFMPGMHKLNKARNDAIKLLMPIVRRRREAMKKEGYEKPNDMLQWMMDERVKRGFHDNDFIYQAEFQLVLSFAAIHTTTNAVTNMLYDLGSMPEYQEIIRNELREELASNGGSWSGPLMKNLKKTDSFMKESQRHQPIAFVSMNRRILKSFTLSDGTYLPAGSTVVNNAHAMNHDPAILHSDSDPNAFDGLRYYKMGQAPAGASKASREAAGKHQFVSISQSSLMFGYGRHACPGRFFAGNEIKLILVKLLALYDLKLEGTGERYKNWSFDAGNNVDTSKNVLFRKAQV